MRKKNIFQKLLFLFTVLLFTGTVFGQTLLNENFGTGTTLPTNWVVINAGTGNDWLVSSTGGFTGSALKYTYNSTNAANTWAFTPDLAMEAGKTYTIQFQQYSGAFAENLAVTIGQGQNVAAQTTTIGTLVGVTNNSYILRSYTYNCTTAGNYNVAFNCYSAADMNTLFVDEVKIFAPVAINGAPTTLTYSTIGANGLTLNWVDNSTNEIGFRVYYSTDNITFTKFGSDILSTTVAAVGGDYSKTVTGLLENTLYYFRVSAYADDESAFLTGSNSTVSGSISGVKPIGPTAGAGGYPSLTAAFADISINGLIGNIELVLQADYVSTVETFPIAVSANATSTKTIKVYPAASGLSITSSNATGTLYLDGSDYVTFDGRVNATGTTKDLVIENTATTAWVIGFINDATNNTIKYCTVKGVETSNLLGLISFGTTTGLIGNDNNTIDNCDIRDGATTYANAIISGGTVGKDNSGITISNCNIYNFYFNGTTCAGIYIASNSTAWTISNNSFYQTNVLNPTTAVGYNVILVGAGDNHNITGNYIGGSAPECGGTAFTLNGVALSNFMYAIRIAASAGVNPNSIQGNTIANISLQTLGTTVGSLKFVGILSAAGVSNIGNITGNVVGSNTVNGSLLFTIGNSAATFTSATAGIYVSAGTGNIQNNIVGGVTINATTASIQAITFNGIFSGGSGTQTISNNIVGSATMANSIQTVAGTTTPVMIAGIYTNAGSGTVTYANNLIANITNLNTPAAGYILGLRNAGGSTVTTTVDNNIIRDLTCDAANVSATNLAAIVGISSSNSGANLVISRNTLYNFASTTSTAAVTINGIYRSGSGAINGLIERNSIYNFYANTTSTSAIINGIYVNDGTSAYINNMIRLGYKADGSDITTGLVINGINEGLGTNNFYNNSVYVGGNNVVAVGNTYCFNSTVTVNTRNFKNNIFVNARSNASGTGKNYAIKISGSTVNPMGLGIDFNNYYTTGTGGVFGFFNSLDVADLAAWRTAVGQDGGSMFTDPKFIDPTATTPDLHISATLPTSIESAGVLLASVTTDFDGQLRSGLTPTDLGADAGDFVVSDISAPAIAYTTFANGTQSNKVLTDFATITDNSLNTTAGTKPRLYFKKATDANAFVGNTSADNGWKYVEASDATSPFDFTIDFSIINGGSVVVADVVQYFVVAQDNVATPNVSSNPSAGFVGTSVAAITSAPTIPNSFTIIPEVCGTLTVGAAGTYPTITAAVAAVNGGMITCPVVISLLDAAYAAETLPIIINANIGSSAVNTVTIKPTQANTVISGSSATHIFNFNNCQYVVIDGSITAGGTTKDLTISNTNTAGTSTINFAAGASNNTVKNSILTGVQTSTSGGVVVFSASTGTTGNNYNTIQNNDITKGATAPAYGIYNIGATGKLNTGNQVLNNRIFDFSNSGIYLAGLSSTSTYSGNEIYLTTPATTGLNGINVHATSIVNESILSNKIHSLNTTSTSYGIYLYDNSPTASLIANNFININSADATTIYGIYDGSGSTDAFNIYYNTILIEGVGTAASISACYNRTYNSVTSFKNNILVNNRTVGTGKHYVIKYSASTTSNLTSDYNNYYSSGGTNSVFGAIGTTDYTDLALFRAVSLKDASSYSLQPTFVSATDLHINTLSCSFSNLGTPVSVTTDIDGDARNATNPDLGADEWIPSGLTVSFNPADAATGVSIGVNPVLTFNAVPRKLDNTEVDASVITFTQAGTPVPFTISTAIPTEITVIPASNLLGLTPYVLSVSGVENSCDIALTGTNSITFTTANTDFDAPLFVSASVENAAPADIKLLFNETMKLTSFAGYTVKVDGTPATISSFSGNNTNTVVLTLATAITTHQVVTVEYDGTGTTTDLVGNPLALFTAQNVTNNVKSAAKDILTFVLTSASNPSLTSDITAVVAANTITFMVSSSLDLTSLIPTITVSEYASVSPLSGVANNFTTNLTYTVTAEDLTTKAYTVVVNKIFGLPYSQDFESAWTTSNTLANWSGDGTIATDWHMNTYTTGWLYSTGGSYSPTGANSTSQSARFHSWGIPVGQSASIYSPIINLSIPGNKTVEFFTINASGTDNVKIYLSEDGGATWGAELGTFGTSTVWTKRSITISSVSPIAKLKITATSDYGLNDIGLDEFKVYVPLANDAAVNLASSLNVVLGNSIVPTAQVANNGTALISSMNVKLDITGPSSYSSTQTISVTNLVSGATQDITFASVTLPNAGQYTATVSTLLSGDENTANDVLSTTYTVFDPNNLAYGYVIYPTINPIYFDLDYPEILVSIADHSTDTYSARGGEWVNGVWYAFDRNTTTLVNRFLTIDHITGVKTILNSTGITYAPNDITYDYTTNTLFGVVSFTGGTFGLYSINMTDGILTQIGTNSTGAPITLACNLQGQLYSVFTDGSLYTINKTTGVATVVGSTGITDITFVQSMAFDHRNGDVLYWNQQGSVLSGGFYSISTTTGTATLIGNLAAGSEVVAFAIPYSIPAAPVAGVLTFVTTDLGTQTETAVANVYDMGEICDTDALTSLIVNVVDDNINTASVNVYYNGNDFGDMVYSGNNNWTFVPSAPFNWSLGVNTLTTTFVDLDGLTLNVTVNFTYAVCAGYDVTFNLNVTNFNGLTQELYISGGNAIEALGGIGSYARWAEPGTNADFLMTEVDATHYTLTLSDVEAGNYEYKYFWVPTGGHSWNNANVGTNMTFSVVEANVVLSDAWTLVGVNELNSNTKIYPNPSKGIFNISVNQNSNLTVADLTGKILFTKELNSNINSIDMTGYASGVYNFTLSNQSEVKTYKVFLNK